jgi:hypothetical protein
MNAPAHVLIETLTRQAPFGIGLWDPIASRLVSEEITVTVHTITGGKTKASIAAAPNRTGVFVPHELRWPADPASPSDRFLVEVRDARDRYLPFVMHVDAAGPRGFVTPACLANVDMPGPSSASPPPLPVYVPLFATPAAPIPAGMTAVRASLLDSTTGRGAAYAVLEVYESGRLVARGVADASGEVAAVFAYPEFAAPPPWSPPGAPPATVRLVDQTWTIDTRVRYGRALPRYRPTASRSSLADLCDVLQQAPAVVETASPPSRFGEVLLHYGEEPVLGERRVGLWIRPA